jgi:hypothetical protein
MTFFSTTLSQELESKQYFDTFSFPTGGSWKKSPVRMS